MRTKNEFILLKGCGLQCRLDAGKDGEPKMTRSGHYRLGFQVLDKEGRLLVEMKGFRVDPTISSLQPPIVKSSFGVYQVGVVGNEFAVRLLNALKGALKEEPS